jgi:hypothetical protein
MTSTPFTNETRELDARSGDGIDVQLLWHRNTGTLSVVVVDWTHATAFELVVDPSEARHAFQHPFAYASFRCVHYEMPPRAHEAQPSAL